MNADCWTAERLRTLEAWADDEAGTLETLDDRIDAADEMTTWQEYGSLVVERRNAMELYARIVAAILWLRCRTEGGVA